MFETNIAFVDHLHIGTTPKQQAGTNNPKILGHPNKDPQHDKEQGAGFWRAVQ
jgi:hypothetical protein